MITKFHLYHIRSQTADIVCGDAMWLLLVSKDAEYESEILEQFETT